MATRRQRAKSYSPPSRSPRADWLVVNVEAWAATFLGVPPAAVKLMLPGGKRRARADKTLGALREDWKS
jgi:hypothetical protein